MVSMRHQNKRSSPSSRSPFLGLSVALNVALIIALVFSQITVSTFPSTRQSSSSWLRSVAIKWHGGHPSSDIKTGSCFCSEDQYCMCTPALAIDLVISSGKDDVWLVRRKDTSQLAVMGGFVQVGETVEQAVRRELKEEMGIDLIIPPQLLGIYSDPRRDNRRHTVSSVFVVHLDGLETPVAADDVKEVKRIPLADIEKNTYFADHMTILLDYRNSLQQSATARVLGPSEGDFAVDVQRSVCGADSLPIQPIYPQ